jgi:hypothetical protein
MLNDLKAFYPYVSHDKPDIEVSGISFLHKEKK